MNITLARLFYSPIFAGILSKAFSYIGHNYKFHETHFPHRFNNIQMTTYQIHDAKVILTDVKHWRFTTIVLAQWAKKLYILCTESAQRLRRRSNIVQMLYKCFVFAGWQPVATDRIPPVNCVQPPWLTTVVYPAEDGQSMWVWCWASVSDNGPALNRHIGWKFGVRWWTTVQT